MFFMAVATAAIVMALVVYWIRRYNHIRGVGSNFEVERPLHGGMNAIVS